MATDPSARKIGLRSMTRVRSTVEEICAASKPGVIAGTTAGAKTRRSPARTASPASMRFVTVETTRHARSSSPWATSVAIVGISADARAPAATSWKIMSGIRNAAKNGSRAPWVPNVVPITTRRTQPSTRETK